VTTTRTTTSCPACSDHPARRVPRPGPVGRALAAGYDLLTAGLERQLLGAHRGRLLAAARGRVLDVGAGTGANLPHYPRERVSELVLLDPSPGMLERARRKAQALGLDVRLLQQPAAALPFEDGRFDTVVFTCALCTIPDPAGAVREARRVLRPDGRLLVLEHVRAQDPGLAAWQDRLTPVWKILNGGCHPNRATRATIEAAGFAFESVAEFVERRMPVPILRPHLLGAASPATAAAGAPPPPGTPTGGPP
jgi:ubiquinone/menaquinone biosynthesis C-methylase UbiE